MRTNMTLSVAIMSGKGGVGKTTIALNLGCALHQAGFRTLLMDCDLGLANLDVLLGIAPEGNLQDVLLGNAAVDDVLHTVDNGFEVLPAASGVPELIDMDADMRSLLLDRLEPTLDNYDFVFLDLGAGINDVVQAFASMVALRIIVITPEPTSLTDSYAIIKVMSSRYNIRDFMVLVNQTESKKEEQYTFARLHGACKRFLGIEPVLLGAVRNDRKLVDAVRRQEPLLRCFPGSPAGQDLQAVAARLQQIRMNMLDWLADRPPLTAPLP